MLKVIDGSSGMASLKKTGKTANFLEALGMDGHIHAITRDRCRIRVSGYGIVVHEGKLLLVDTPNGKWFFPGGEVELGETLAEAIQREVKEETGIIVTVKDFLSFSESFFSFDLQKGYQNYGLYFICNPLTFSLSDLYRVDGDSERAAWVDVKALRPEDFHPPADRIFELISKTI